MAMVNMPWNIASDLLKKKKLDKNTSLSNLCQQAILNGFYHEISGVNYHFSYDNEAQLNFQDTTRLFDNNMIKTVNWTAMLHEGKVRIVLNKAMFNELYLASVKHKLNTISYYRDILIPKVNSCTSLEELELIEWNSSEITSVAELNSGQTLEKRLEEVSIAQAQGDYELLSLIMMGMM